MPFENLHSSLQEVGDQLQAFSSANQLVGLQPSDVLICWFICALTGAQPSEAQASLTGGGGDRALDAIHIDFNNRHVLVVQGKLRESPTKTEKRESILDFASWASLLNAPDEDELLVHVLNNVNPSVHDRVTRARQVIREGFRLEMAYVTTGRVTDDVRSSADLVVRERSPQSQLTVYDYALTLSFIEEWRDDVVPVIPFATLRLEKHGDISHSSVAGVQTRVAVVRGEQVAGLFGEFGRTIFARNIRGYQGETSINDDIRNTIRKDPEAFLHLNNGITIVCSDLQVVDRGSHQTATLRFPQIINGQQTTRVLSAAGEAASEVLVLVRLIVLGGGGGTESSRLELVSKIVKATNSQNSIKPSDLYSNDPKQISLERRLRGLGYQYLRKKETAREAATRPNSHLKPQITKETLAQAIGSCLHDGFVGTIGPKKAFSPDFPYYEEFFGLSLDTQLNAFWLHRFVYAASRRKEAKKFAAAKWLVLHDTWQRLPTAVREGTAFHSTLHRSDDGRRDDALGRFITLRFLDMNRFHERSQKDVDLPVEMSKFFKGPMRTKLLAFEGSSMPKRSAGALKKVLELVH